MPDVYILGRVDNQYHGITSPMVFKNHSDIEKYLNQGWCTERIGYSMNILKHADWHGAGLVKLTHGNGREILFRVYVSKVYGEDK
jgi:hypothetical protein